MITDKLENAKTYYSTHQGLMDALLFLQSNDLNALSVQFIPSPCPGPRDTCQVYDRFIDMLGSRAQGPGNREQE